MTNHNPPPPTLPESPNETLALIPLEDEFTPPTEPQERIQRQSGGRGCGAILMGMVGCSGILVLAVIVLILMIPNTVGGIFNAFANLLGASSPPVANVISSQTIITGIQPMGQLVSVSSQLAQADIQVGIGQANLINACGFSANHVAQGAVEAGIDLSRIGEESLVYDAARDTYILTVPAPQLTSCRVDYIRQYERSTTVCAVDWDEARLIANYISLTQFRDTAIEGGILARAESETRLVLGNFVRLLTGKNVEIIFEAPTVNTFPQSCSPATPQGWSRNVQGQWIKSQ